MIPFLWHDWWHLDCFLNLKYGHRVVYDAAISLSAKVSSVLNEDNWIWNLAHSEDLLNIQSKLCLVETGNEDKPVWISKKSGNYSCACAWNCIRKRYFFAK